MVNDWSGDKAQENVTLPVTEHQDRQLDFCISRIRVEGVENRIRLHVGQKEVVCLIAAQRGLHGSVILSQLHVVTCQAKARAGVSSSA